MQGVPSPKEPRGLGWSSSFHLLVLAACPAPCRCSPSERPSLSVRLCFASPWRGFSGSDTRGGVRASSNTRALQWGLGKFLLSAAPSRGALQPSGASRGERPQPGVEEWVKWAHGSSSAFPPPYSLRQSSKGNWSHKTQAAPPAVPGPARCPQAALPHCQSSKH